MLARTLRASSAISKRQKHSPFNTTLHASKCPSHCNNHLPRAIPDPNPLTPPLPLVIKTGLAVGYHLPIHPSSHV